MGSVVKSLDKAINSMELQKISAVMDKFEQQFEDLDVHTSVSGISSSYGVSMTSLFYIQEVKTYIVHFNHMVLYDAGYGRSNG